ncbi:hypothetical protein SBY92_004403 [Candida maltosa Xu316]|uniref:Uncharacterized protein n=1 Tax=Candida maltosa (strain Xu316) TaxID=1245528 RepID=M3JC46_CANMX|nr:hypothetical protein G210_5447 [Candida maltosa Xu316]
MTSRLDHIFSYVNEIERRTNKLTDVVSNSNELINSLSLINDSVTQFDNDIDEIRELIDSNNKSINEFKSLHEKAFYLESNILHNDNITNFQSFEHITEEYIHLLSNLRGNDKYSCQDVQEDTPIRQSEIVEPQLQHEPHQPHQSSPASSPHPQPQEPVPEPENEVHHPPDLKKMISISNLKLKPMRCTSTENQTLSKKKSRYRLSSIYNINPIAYDDSVVGTSTTYSTTSSDNNHNASISTREEYEDDHRMENSVSHSYETLESHLVGEEEQVSATTKNYHENIAIMTTPDSDKSMTRGRSNSLPTTSTKVTDTDILKEFDCDLDILRLNRLKHFISVSHLPGKQTYDVSHMGDQQEDDENDEDDIFFNDIYNKSPTPQSRRSINDPNYDVVSIVSDFSYYSPDKQQHVDSSKDDLFDYDNFNDFLRKSRLDLNKDLKQAFPHLIHDEPKYKFHNPIEKQLSNSSISTAMLNVQASAVMNNTKSIPITQNIPRLSQSASAILHSYVDKPPRPPPPPQTTTDSTHAFSFNESSFFRFLESPKKPKVETPQKIKELKRTKLIKSNPISIPSEAQLKRRPQNNTYGSFVSKLTVGSTGNTTREGGSVFKNSPVIRSYDRSALRDALSSSLLD